MADNVLARRCCCSADGDDVCTRYVRGVRSGDSAAMQRRAQVLKELSKVVHTWVADRLGQLAASGQCACTDVRAAAATARLITYGSSSLPGLTEWLPDADVDLLCLVPCPLDRDRDFFGPSSSPSLATRLVSHPDIQGVVPVPVAFVPCLKLMFFDVPVDMTFCALPLEWLRNPAFDPARPTPELLMAASADPQAARSLAAVHASTSLHAAVGDTAARSFGVLYTAVRLWASRRGIHGKQLGFPGGVSWAVLCTAVCQAHPGARPDQLLEHFFKTYSVWSWPKPVEILHGSGRSANGVGGWDPERNPADKAHVMPILTPRAAGTLINSTHGVTRATFGLIKRELSRAAKVVTGLRHEANWQAALFEATDFFRRYQQFVCLEFCYADAEDDPSLCAEASGAARWLALCESLLRLWVPKLEAALQLPVCTLHPFSRRLTSRPSAAAGRRFYYCFGFDRAGRQDGVKHDQACRQTALEFRKNAVARAQSDSSWRSKADTWITAGMEIEVRLCLQTDLPQWSPPPDIPRYLAPLQVPIPITSTRPDVVPEPRSALAEELEREQSRSRQLETRLSQVQADMRRFKQIAAEATARRAVSKEAPRGVDSDRNVSEKAAEKSARQKDRMKREVDRLKEELRAAHVEKRNVSAILETSKETIHKQEQEIKLLRRNQHATKGPARASTTEQKPKVLKQRGTSQRLTNRGSEEYKQVQLTSAKTSNRRDGIVAAISAMVTDIRYGRSASGHWPSLPNIRALADLLMWAGGVICCIAIGCIAVYVAFSEERLVLETGASRFFSELVKPRETAPPAFDGDLQAGQDILDHEGHKIDDILRAPENVGHHYVSGTPITAVGILMVVYYLGTAAHAMFNKRRRPDEVKLSGNSRTSPRAPCTPHSFDIDGDI
jgi:poly(A) polymerase Pap1